MPASVEPSTVLQYAALPPRPAVCGGRHQKPSHAADITKETAPAELSLIDCFITVYIKMARVSRLFWLAFLADRGFGKAKPLLPYIRSHSVYAVVMI